MNAILKNAYRLEMQKARSLFGKNDYKQAFAHLERAHVLGQRFFVPHTLTHWWMLRVGWAQRDAKEIAGQVLRLALTPLGHLTGRLPLGNTGGANVSAFKPMPFSQEVEALLREASSQHDA